MEEHDSASKDTEEESLESLKESISLSYTSATETKKEIDVLSDTISDNDSDISTGSDSSVGSDYGTKLVTHGPVKKFFLHLGLLLQKTLWMYSRSKAFLICVLLCPIVWCLSIAFFNYEGNSIERLVTPKGRTHEMRPVSHCLGEECVSIGYSILGDSNPDTSSQYNWIDDIMQSVATDN